MKTLIELYDERPMDNVLATETFRPQETIFVCPPKVAEDRALQETLRQYFRHRDVPVKLAFVPVSLLNAEKVEKTLRQVIRDHPDCAMDISGGTDAALYAAGAVSQDIPVFTYSRKTNTFYEIHNAEFARNLPCKVRLDVASCFLMAGGRLLPGREDNAKLEKYENLIDALFDVYRQYRDVWNRQVNYLQRISVGTGGDLKAAGPWTVKADNHQVTADADLLRALEKAELIRDLELGREEVSFSFRDTVTRFWLRDVGSALELQVWRACRAAGCFDDVVLSAVVDWQVPDPQAAVTNEIDVAAVRGVIPLFISCKATEIRTEALNELAILRDRFGGKGSRAMIVTSVPMERSRGVTHRRAAELGIEVVEWEDVALERLAEIVRENQK